MEQATLPDRAVTSHTTTRRPRAAGVQPRPSLSTSVQPLETKSEAVNVGIFGQKTHEVRKTETLSEYCLEIKKLLQLKEERHSKDFEKKCRRESFRIEPATQLELDFRHSFWHVDREKVKLAFMELGTTASRQERFIECGSAARVLETPDGTDAKIVCNKCHDRFCKACGNERQRLITQNVLAFCQDKQLRFVTLTLKHNREKLSDQVDRLFTAFDRLRERKAWKQRVKGAAVFFELKPAKDKNEWHPHLHIITECDYFPQSLLSSEWLVCTGDSSIVDIRFVYDQASAVSYVAKYASKPIDGSLYHRPAMLREAIKALEGRHACTVIGKWRCTKTNPNGLRLHEKPEDTGEWIDVGTIASVIERARAGDAHSKALCQRLNLNGDCAHPGRSEHPPDTPREIPF